MKKLIKILFAIIVVVLLGTPYFAGRILERDFNAFIAQANEVGKGELTIVGKFYRGFYSSTATSEITLKNSYTSVQLAHFIKHGPVIFNFNGWFSPSSYIPRGMNMGVINTSFTGNIQKFLEIIYGKDKGYDLTTTISLHGDIDTKFTTQAFNSQFSQGKMNWQGSTSTLNTDKELLTIDGSTTIPLIEYSEALAPNLKQSINFKNISVGFKSQKNVDDSIDIKVEDAKIISNDATELELQAYALKMQRKINNNLIDIDINKDFNKLLMGVDSYGPLKFDLQLKNLNSKAIAGLKQSQEQLAMTGTLPDDLVLQLFANKMTLTANLQFTTPDGPINGKFDASVGDPKITAAVREQILPTLTVSQHIQIAKKIFYKLLTQFAQNQLKNREVQFYLKNRTSTITNPYTMSVDQKQKLINDWLTKIIAGLTAQKYIVANGDDFVIDVNMVGSKLTINGIEKTDADVVQLQGLLEVLPAPQVPVPAPATTQPTEPTSTLGTPAPSAPSTTVPTTTPTAVPSTTTRVDSGTNTQKP